jgi:multiple sugar transport system permease protein
VTVAGCSVPGVRFAAAAIVVINGFFPAIWILFTSLKSETELFRKPITYFPHEPTLKNYIAAAVDQPLFQVFMKNSIIVALLATVVSLVVAAFAAYAIARLNLKRRQLILTAIIASSMFPLITLLVPIFETMRALGWLNSYLALVFPYVVLNLPVCTLVLVSFFQSIPRDLENAAMIDGCTRFGTLWRVVLPLSAPGCSRPAFSRLSTHGTNSCWHCLSTRPPQCAHCQLASRSTRVSSPSRGQSFQQR